MYWLITTLISAIVIGTVITVTVYVINRKTLKKTASSYANSQDLKFKIKNMISEGNYNKVTIGLLDTNQYETKEIEVYGEVFEKDFEVYEIVLM